MIITARAETQLANLCKRLGLNRDLYEVDWVYAMKGGAKIGKAIQTNGCELVEWSCRGRVLHGIKALKLSLIELLGYNALFVNSQSSGRYCK